MQTLSDLKFRYCKSAPSNQTIADIFKGNWLSVFPEEYQVEAGFIRHFDWAVEMRVKWGDSVLPAGVKGKSVLELGPYEAYNTWQLEQLGAHPVTAIEANALSYLKCLAVKEITGLRARFLHGDFIAFLENQPQPVDIVWASGVLYHQVEPLKLLGLASKITDTIFLHTHYFDDARIRQNDSLARNFQSGKDLQADFDGFRARLHYRSYKTELSGEYFAGGMADYSYWMEKEDIFKCLQHFGFAHFDTMIDDPTNPNGPGMVIMARRTP
jgi:hypothetical protein